MIDLFVVEKKLQCVSLVMDVDFIDFNTLRISTPLKFPDGSFIDVFVEIENGLPLQFKVSDLSQTFSWLLDMAIDVPKAGRRKSFLASILDTYGVIERDGEIYTYANDMNELPNAVLSIAQSSLRISDLMFTQRVSRTTDFNENFEDFLDVHNLSFTEKRFEVRGKSVVIPYFVKGERTSTLIQTLSTKSVASAPKIALDAFARWYDINRETELPLCVTVFDDESNIFKQPDLDRISDYSKLIPWSDQPTLLETLLG